MLSQPTTLPTDRSGGMAGGFVVGWELSVPASSPAPREEKVPPIVRGAFLFSWRREKMTVTVTTCIRNACVCPADRLAVTVCAKAQKREAEGKRSQERDGQ